MRSLRRHVIIDCLVKFLRRFVAAFEKTLPKIGDLITNGGVYRQKVRCGKEPCKCSRGEPHFAYYFFTRRKGKLTKFYVRKADVDHFSNWVRKSVQSKRRDRQALKSDREQTRRQLLDGSDIPRTGRDREAEIL